jgi:Zn finger protein HypA/HybF involved in hydrogenase expression
MTDEPQTVHCLVCDNVFTEAKPPIETCPHCGNTDMQLTVYLQGEE